MIPPLTLARPKPDRLEPPTQARILAHIRKRKSVPRDDLAARFMGRAHPNRFAHILDRLLKRGLVESFNLRGTTYYIARTD